MLDSFAVLFVQVQQAGIVLLIAGVRMIRKIYLSDPIVFWRQQSRERNLSLSFWLKKEG